MLKVAGNGYARSGLLVVHGGGNGAPSAAGVESYGATGGGTGIVARGGNGVTTDPQLAELRVARMKGYEGDPCEECGNLTMVRNGTCLKCDTCGATSGCS
jgi:ribonucleoside-diphosphate reductase alpha chain